MKLEWKAAQPCLVMGEKSGTKNSLSRYEGGQSKCHFTINNVLTTCRTIKLCSLLVSRMYPEYLSCKHWSFLYMSSLDLRQWTMNISAGLLIKLIDKQSKQG